MNKESYLYKNRKLLLGGLIFFIVFFVVLTITKNIKASENAVEFTIDYTEKINLTVHSLLEENGTVKDLSGVGYKMAINYTGDDYLQFNKESNGNYNYDKIIDDEGIDLDVNNNGLLNLKNIPVKDEAKYREGNYDKIGDYILYESKSPNDQIIMFDNIVYVQVTALKENDQEVRKNNYQNQKSEVKKLKITVKNITKDVKVTQNGININIEITHHKSTTPSSSTAPKLKCVSYLSTDDNISEGYGSNLKIEKIMWPPTNQDWEIDLNVGAYPVNYKNGSLIGNNEFYSFKDYCLEKEKAYYSKYLEEQQKEEYTKIKNEVGEAFKKYFEEYKEYYKERYSKDYSQTVESWWNNSGAFYYYDENDNYLYYSIKNIDTYNEYLAKYYNSYYNEYEDYLEEKYRDEYDKYISEKYETIKLSNKGSNEYKASKTWNSCIPYYYYNSKSAKDLYVDIVETGENNNYDISFASNIAGLKQEGNRFYGTIAGAVGHEVVVTVTNWDKNYGDLQITKKLFDSNGIEQTDKEFNFKIVLTPPIGKTLADKYSYTINGGSEYHELILTNDGNSKTGNITIKAGDTIRLIGLLTGTAYEVNEIDSQGYDVTPQNNKGVVASAKITDVYFTNTKLNTGILTVYKTVIGDKEDYNREFTFTVTLNDKSINGNYGEMIFKDGVATFTLKHNETKTAVNLPTGTQYEVREETDKDYNTNKENEKGTIKNGEAINVRYTNMRNNVLPNTSDGIMIALIIGLISFGILVYLKLNKKYMV